MRTLIIKLLRYYTLYFPIRFGKVPLLRLFSSLGLFNNVELTAEFEKGLKAKFSVSDWVQQLVYFFGTYIYEKEQVSYWRELSGSAVTVLDIGSNFGFYSLISAKENPVAKIYSFEPSPMMFKRIGENILLNQYTNINPVQKGVSDKSGQFEFFVSEDNNTGMSSLVKRSNSKGESLIIDVVTIDAFIAERQIADVNLVKIDVEGNEFNVLLGMKGVLKKDKPTIFVELYNDTLSKFGHTVTQVYEYLWSLNYQCVTIGNHGQFHVVSTPVESGLAIFISLKD